MHTFFGSGKPGRAILLLLALIIACSLLPKPAFIPDDGPAPLPQSAIKVLYIGNSFTAGGNLPLLVQELSRDTRVPIAAAAHAPGGTYLEWHAEQPKTKELLRAARWDYVVLQDCSTCPLRYVNSFHRGVREMVRQVRQTGATPVLYMTWADRLRQSDMEIIEAEYRQIARELSVSVVPVGAAWRLALQRDPALPLFESDDHHASRTGALLSAFVFLKFFRADAPSPQGVQIRAPAQYLYEVFFPAYQVYADAITAKLLIEIVSQVTL